MSLRLTNIFLLSLAVAMFIDVLLVLRTGEPDVWTSSACVVAFVLRGLDKRPIRRPIPVVAGLLALWAVANNSKLLESNWGFWTLVGFVLALLYALWERLFP